MKPFLWNGIWITDASMDETSRFEVGADYYKRGGWWKRPLFKVRLAGGVNWARLVYVWLILALVLFNLFCVVERAQAEWLVNFDIIRQIESGGNPAAYNRNSGARGLYQITDICRRDYNQMTRSGVTPLDLWNPATNEAVARWYMEKRIPQLLRARGHAVTLEAVLTAYNAGIGRVGGRLPLETVNYIKKYKRGGR